jgi:putative flippase GtrA
VLGGALRFGVVGSAGVAVNMLALHLLYGLAQLPLLLAAMLAVETSIAHNYLLNDRWTFNRSHPSWGRFARFNVSALLSLSLNVGVVMLLVSQGTNYLAANLVGVASGLPLNFGASAGWVWKEATK